MGIFNYYGLIIIVLILLPNIAFAALNKDGFKNAYENKTLENCEQIGRFGCFILMIVNVPYTYFGFWFDRALTAYLAVNGALTLVYLLGWVLLWKKPGVLRALLLSITPSAIFLFSGIMLANVPLSVLAVLFAITHITLSYKNAAAEEKKQENK